MPLEGDRFIIANLAVFSIQGFAKALKDTSSVQIRGISKFVNDIRNGKRLGDSIDKFYQNILESVSAIKTDDSPDIGPRISQSMGRSITTMREYFAMINTDDPIRYHASHLIPPDLKELAVFFTDVTSSFRRIDELMKLSNKALSLPALKDQYNLTFEKAYKPLRALLYRLMDDGAVSKSTLNERIEGILCLEWYSGKQRDAKSDIRIIRNLFAHPDRIDRYDHYQIETNGITIKLFPDDLMSLNTLLITKLMLLTFLSSVVLDLELYGRVFGT